MNYNKFSGGKGAKSSNPKVSTKGVYHMIDFHKRKAAKYKIFILFHTKKMNSNQEQRSPFHEE